MERRHRAASRTLVRPSTPRLRPARPSAPLAPASAAAAGRASRDTLSDLLRTVRLTGALFFVFEGAARWGETVPDGAALAPIILPRAQHVISYHVVTRGACWARVSSGPAVRLEAGDVVVFPRGDAYAMWVSSTPAPRSLADDLTFFREMAAGRLPFTIRDDGEGEAALHLVCGFLGCDLRPFNPLLATLPALLRVRSAVAGSDGSLPALVELTVAESRQARPGGDCVRLRLGELLFVEVVRQQLAALPAGQTGWLAGLRDPVVGRALALLHERPGHGWTLEALARRVASSRSALAERFTRLVGQPPMQYLTRWRMQVAARLLADGPDKVAAVALDVGYDSEAAFSRAFKKATGLPPAAWRRRHAPPDAPQAPAARTYSG